MSWRCFLLWHCWRPQAAQVGKVYRGTKITEVPLRNYTDVLYRCERCDAVKVRELEGRWTLEQLLLGEEMRDSPRPKVSA